ncbi:MAG: hypothetical protein ABF384_01245 [Verrucomicrobiales bacterium]
MTEIEHTAFHEAGHAVAHARLDIDQLSASIIPDDDRSMLGGNVASDSFWDEEGVKGQVLALLSGYAALVARGLKEDEAKQGSISDFAKAQDLLQAFSLGTILEWKNQAVELMMRPENVRAVARVAQELLERQRIDVDDIECCIEIADGLSTEEDFSRMKQIRDSIGS